MVKVCKSGTVKYRDFFKGMAKIWKNGKKMGKKSNIQELVFDVSTDKVD